MKSKIKFARDMLSAYLQFFLPKIKGGCPSLPKDYSLFLSWFSLLLLLFDNSKTISRQIKSYEVISYCPPFSDVATSKVCCYYTQKRRSCLVISNRV